MSTNTKKIDVTPKIIISSAIALLPVDLSRSQLSVITLIALTLQRQINSMVENPSLTIGDLFGSYNGLLPDGSLEIRTVYGEYGIDCRWFRSMMKSSSAFHGHITIERAEDVGRRASCLIKISRQMLEMFMDMSKGYFYANPLLSIRPENKSDVRMYWLTQMYASMKGFTMTVPQIRSILGASNTYDGYFTFEDHIISHAQNTMSFYFEHGMSPTRFSFVRVYNRPKHFTVAGGSPANGRGKPDALKFTITTKACEAEDKKQNDTDKNVDNEVVRTLREDLHLPEKLATAEAARVSKEGKEEFINFAISVKETIDDKKSYGEKLINPTAYVCKCLHNYFAQRYSSMHRMQERHSANVHQELPVSPSKKVRSGNADVVVAEDIVKKIQSDKIHAQQAEEAKSSRHTFAEWSQLWQQVMEEYDGPAKEALQRATFKGEERDVFCVQFETREDKAMCEKDYQRLNGIARRVLKLQSRFQPGVVMDVK